MDIVFRVDASLQIGTGHVMRCLALAQALAAGRCTSTFICRSHEGHMIEYIRSLGFPVTALPRPDEEPVHGRRMPKHAAWLGVSWERDALQTCTALGTVRPQWLIVDHYGLDAKWELALRVKCYGLMTIDDLADRKHNCDLLLDQNLGPTPADYFRLVPPSCRVLTGPEYALLRNEFAQWREFSLSRRKPTTKTILIALGGVDLSNATGRVLRALMAKGLPDDISVTVVLGAHAPWSDDVHRTASEMPFSTRVLSDVRDIARLMAEADLAIGAAGTSSWERCAMGLPTIVLAVADNQRRVAESLETAGAGLFAGDAESGPSRAAEFSMALLCDATRLSALSQAAAALCDGFGATRIAGVLGVERNLENASRQSA